MTDWSEGKSVVKRKNDTYYGEGTDASCRNSTSSRPLRLFGLLAVGAGLGTTRRRFATRGGEGNEVVEGPGAHFETLERGTVSELQPRALASHRPLLPVAVQRERLLANLHATQVGVVGDGDHGVGEKAIVPDHEALQTRERRVENPRRGHHPAVAVVHDDRRGGWRQGGERAAAHVGERVAVEALAEVVERGRVGDDEPTGVLEGGFVHGEELQAGEV